MADFVFQPVTHLRLKSLRVLDSPLLRFGEALMEIGPKSGLNVHEQVRIVLERVGREISAKQEEMLASVFCLIAPEARLRPLLQLPPDEFKSIARRSVRAILPHEATGVTVNCALDHFAIQIRNGLKI